MVVQAPELVLAMDADNIASWDLHPDGRRFIVTVPAAAGRRPPERRRIAVPDPAELVRRAAPAHRGEPAMSDAMARLSAALADRYRIERELGAGRMATVYLAEDLKHQRKVAVKVLRPELAATLGAERFAQRDRASPPGCSTPTSSPLLDSGEADGLPTT